MDDADTIACKLEQLAVTSARWLNDAALPLWSTAGRDDEGFVEALDDAGRPVERFRRVRVHARQLAVYAIALREGWGVASTPLVEWAVETLLQTFRLPDGGFRGRLSRTGEPDERPADLYDHAFILYALAEAASALPQRDDLADAAAELRGAVVSRFRHGTGGYREDSADEPFQANAQMHLLEAALTWENQADDPAWAALADELAEFGMAHFIDAEGGFLREVFTADWGPAAGARGRRVEPGHQFEWAYLLTRWGASRNRPDALAAADRLYRVGADHGVDERGVTVNELDPTLQVVDPSARLWPQTERLRAALTSAQGAQDQGLRLARLADAASAARALQLYTDTPVKGLFRDRLGPKGGFDAGPSPASSLYHIAGALLALRRASGR